MSCPHGVPVDEPCAACQDAHKYPRGGDRVAHCGHIDEKGRGQVGIALFQWQGSAPVSLVRRDGSRFTVRWLMLCERCFARHALDPSTCPLNGDFVWPEGAAVRRFHLLN
jgi:hypothetical protein